MFNLQWDALISPILLSIRISIVSSIIVFALGLLAAWYMTKAKRRGKIWIETAFMLPLVLPPTVVGFILLVLLGRNGLAGEAIELLFGQPIVFTWWAAIIASVVVAFPLVYQTMKVGFGSIERDLTDAAKSQGATDWQLLRHITIPLAWRSMFTAFVLGFARSLGEFGATLMIAGNIPGRTQTIPTAIYVAVDSGHMTMAWFWTGSMMLISFLMMLIVSRRGRELGE